ncbi:hypothetical protein JAAARDRAFT_188456 [Jaapia argillacea MUCL 33604]|uniref:Uncharacterized protein n=1 Tax=Jaapia argillacea MUCL 33604 TaxID=933084 RepID=A0A067QDR5_9AGAM|nr:hypothetical protein JAAARDRAFT_188456 [Jaapia argillacea MUCL 33604]
MPQSNPTGTLTYPSGVSTIAAGDKCTLCGHSTKKGGMTRQPRCAPVLVPANPPLLDFLMWQPPLVAINQNDAILQNETRVWYNDGPRDIVYGTVKGTDRREDGLQMAVIHTSDGSVHKIPDKGAFQAGLILVNVNLMQSLQTVVEAVSHIRFMHEDLYLPMIIGEEVIQERREEEKRVISEKEKERVISKEEEEEEEEERVISDEEEAQFMEEAGRWL